MISAPHSDAGAPALDLGVQSRLRRLDPRLRVTWSQWSLDPFSGKPITARRTGERIYAPGYTLWIYSRGAWEFVREYCCLREIDGAVVEIHPSLVFGHREVAALEADPARTMSAREILRRESQKKEDAKEKRSNNYDEGRDDFCRANARRMFDLAVDGKSGVRQARIASYPGQSVRSTPGSFLSDPKEDGWEMPA